MSKSFPVDFKVLQTHQQKWQPIVDTLARVSGFVAALIMRVDASDLEVFASSQSPGNPYRQGARDAMKQNHYCEKVIATRGPVHCPNARKPPVWENPHSARNMICYYGLPILWPDGVPFGTLCILDSVEKDISQHTHDLITLFREWLQGDLAKLVKDEEELRKSADTQRDAQDRYSAIFEQAAIGIARVGIDGQWIEVNDKLCDIFGYKRDQLTALTWQDITVQEDLSKDLENVACLVSGLISTYTMEKRYIHKDGHTVWALLSVSLVRAQDGSPNYFISVIKDISEQKLMQKEIERTQKMETMGRLVGGIAHEFNNILAAVTSNLFLARHHPDKLEGFIADAEKLCFQASEMIHGLLVYARKEEAEKSVFHLNSIVKELVKHLRVLLPSNIQFSAEISDSPMLINGNAIQIQQIVLNLVNNARDALETIARPEVSLRLMPVDVSPGHFEGATGMTPRSGERIKMARLVVADNGIGIKSTQLGRIFEPFYTTKPAGKGTGLGLAMVANLMQQHEGKIEVDSTPGQGTKFSAYFPLVAEKEEVVEPTDNPGELTRSGAGKTLLLVDDNRVLLDVTAGLLELFGYRVEKAGNGEDALRKYTSGRRFDGVLTDIVMPNMGGIELCARLKAYNPDVRLLFMTGHSDDTDVRDLDCPVLFKPVDPKKLNAALYKMLHS